MSAAHSTWGASKFESIMLCPGKHVLEAGKPNSVSKYAAEGTAAHQVLTWALQQSKPAAEFIGVDIEADGFVFVVDEDMAKHVQVTIDYVQDLAGDDGIVLVDQKVNYSSYLDVPYDDAWGTLDVAVLRGDEITSLDLKYGMGVEVSAEKNPQVMLYALGILATVQGLMGDFTKVRLAISQPRIKAAPSEYDLSVEALEMWGHNTAKAAVVACLHAMTLTEHPQFNETFLRPGEKQCKFCKAKATCPQLRAEVAETVGMSVATPDEFAENEPIPASATDGRVCFDPAAWLSACLSKVDLIEDWCKAVRAEVERRLLAGDNVPGYKLVQGKQGNRAWADAKVAEATLKSMRVKIEDMYDFKLISPTSAEKLAKAEVIGKRQWPKVEALITRAPAKPHVAPVSDSRPALVVTPVADDFTDVTTADDLA